MSTNFLKEPLFTRVRTLEQHIFRHIERKSGNLNLKSTYFVNSSDTKYMDIASCKDGQEKIVYTTGLHAHELKDDNRIELVCKSEKANHSRRIASIAATAAFAVMDMDTCGKGTILENSMQYYLTSPILKHIVLLPATTFNVPQLQFENVCIEWLSAIPISDAERDYIKTNGIAAFDVLAKEKNINYFDLDRSSMI